MYVEATSDIDLYSMKYKGSLILSSVYILRLLFGQFKSYMRLMERNLKAVHTKKKLSHHTTGSFDDRSPSLVTDSTSRSHES